MSMAPTAPTAPQGSAAYKVREVALGAVVAPHGDGRTSYTNHGGDSAAMNPGPGFGLKDLNSSLECLTDGKVSQVKVSSVWPLAKIIPPADLPW